MVRGREVSEGTPHYSADGGAEPGHDSGHAPGGSSWGDLVHHWRAEHGGWAALAEELVRRAGDVGLPKDLGSIQRGLRRLSERGQLEGGQYGRWMLRYFGVPPRT